MLQKLSALMLPATLAVLGSATAWGATEQASVPPQGSAQSGQALQDVTVTARRAQLEKRVSKFVQQIAGRDNENGDGLPLWHTAVCPSVTGIARKQAEFLLWRITQIGRTAGVPLAAENCRPNLFIFVTAEPKQLLAAMQKRDLAVSFGNSTSPLTIEEFVATARAVKVWYDSHRETAEYAAPSYGVGATHPCISADFQGTGGAHLPPAVCDSERASHITTASALVPVFSYVYVIVDPTRLRGVTLQQLADYVGMVGLAQIEPTARVGDAPTILKLFDGAPRAAPSGMTAWDQSFLESLYATEQRLKQPRREIANTMARQLAH